MRLANKVALITGAGSGLGEYAVQTFAKQGAKIVVTDINEDAGNQVAEAVRQNGGEAIFLKLNVTDAENWQSVVAQAVEKFGKLNILINSAGIAAAGDVEQVTLDELRKSMALNVEGPLLGIQAVAPAMRQSGGGSIVNIASMAGILGISRSCAYSTSKGAVRSMSKSAAMHFAKAGDNIRVNILNPSYVKTPMLESVFSTEQIQGLASIHPLKRIANLDDVANALLYLASDESAFITGFDLNLDGGFQVGF